MDYLIRFAQIHESFRLAELEALAILEGVDLNVVEYSNDSPFCIVRLSSPEAAKQLIRRSILVQTIYELWGSGSTIEELHASIKAPSTQAVQALYATSSFKFVVDTFYGHRSEPAKQSFLKSLIAALNLAGPIRLTDPEQTFTVFEQWPWRSVPLGIQEPSRIWLGRLVGASARGLERVHDLKKRRYISTTSMDATLALVGANIALAGPGKLFYDPFAGTGGLPLACAQFGALAWGSDLDGRTLRGDEPEDGGKSSSGTVNGTGAGLAMEDGAAPKAKAVPTPTVRGNFEQYGLLAGLGGLFSADLTNSPVRKTAPGSALGNARLFDGIVCDPPYGVREGLKVLGVRDTKTCERVIERGKRDYKNPGFVPPKKHYSFARMLDDILQFAVETLVDHGRLSFWMPSANDEEGELSIPQNPYLELVVVCVQPFNKWSRRLITYRRIPDGEVDREALEAPKVPVVDAGTTPDELNPFRKAFFSGFQPREQGLTAVSDPVQ